MQWKRINSNEYQLNDKHNLNVKYYSIKKTRQGRYQAKYGKNRILASFDDLSSAQEKVKEHLESSFTRFKVKQEINLQHTVRCLNEVSDIVIDLNFEPVAHNNLGLSNNFAIWLSKLDVDIECPITVHKLHLKDDKKKYFIYLRWDDFISGEFGDLERVKTLAIEQKYTDEESHYEFSVYDTDLDKPTNIDYNIMVTVSPNMQ